MNTFSRSRYLANGINDFLYFFSLMVLRIRARTTGESAASILNEHIHSNRSLHHDNLDKGLLLFHYIHPIYLFNIHWPITLVLRKANTAYFIRRVNNIKYGNLDRLVQLCRIEFEKKKYQDYQI